MKLWEIVPKNQKEIIYDFKLVSVQEGFGVANWKVSRTLVPSNKKQEIDGIFIIKLNEEGLCTYFKQWSTVKEL